MATSKRDDRQLDGATTIRLSDYETRAARFSWRDEQVQRSEIRLPRVAAGEPRRGDRDEPR
jgi:hypothetical protein